MFQKIFALTSKDDVSYIAESGLVAALFAVTLHMMAGAVAPAHRDFNYRVPPSWSPDNETTYSFRAFIADISLWVMLADLQPHQQCTAIITRLGGAAREMARMISPQAILQGGIKSTALQPWAKKQG